MNPMESLRQEVVDFLNWELIGPDSSDEELELSEPPTLRYSAGVLFPGGHIIDEIEESGEPDGGQPPSEDSVAVTSGDDGTVSESRSRGNEDSPEALLDTPVQLANAQYPAAIGLSFVCKAGTELRVRVRGATYIKLKRETDTVWRRRPLCHQIEPNGPVERTFTADTGGKPSLVIRQPLVHGLKLHAVLRKRDCDQYLITVALWNDHFGSHDSRPDPAECFFQIGFRVESVHDPKAIREYRLGTADSDDPEEKELRLLYRERRAFAIGHGCAADWPASQQTADGGASWVGTAVLPATEVRPLEATETDDQFYDMLFLAGEDKKAKEIVDALSGLPDAYEGWVKSRRQESKTLDLEFRGAADRNLERCESCLKRIRSGISLLGKDPEVMRAFMLANRAMYLQQQGPEYRSALTTPSGPPATAMADRGRWRVFQLAFVLMNLNSIADHEHEERELVDLIWFPTGGGKTEAYLGLTAFTIFLRKLRKPDEHGCVALMRYTLRLLTAQQFERAAAMISACEYLRRNTDEELGKHSITIGLWAGAGLTPNTRGSAVTALKAWSKDEDEPNPFQLLRCPWCGGKLDDRKNPGYVRVGTGLAETVRFFCPQALCAMSRTSAPKVGIPAAVIDEDIYSFPPTLLIGTVDKFAILAWKEAAGILLTGQGDSMLPPDLIIQDELHLISGPLGTIVGLYEAVIDRLCRRAGQAPKVVASTATIRRADEQCRQLFDRETAIFPPAGLSIRDSWFAVEQSEKTGRLYVGVFGSAAPSYATSSLRTIAALLQAGKSLDTAPLNDAVRDPYWTTVWYFNSLRELGRASTQVDADIPEYLKAISIRKNLTTDQRRFIGQPVELTSRRTGDEIAKLLKRLDVTYPDHDALDTLLATNMISVGIDVPRLGLMAVAGQPKTTSEYIQATSRVGRKPDVAPGLVATLYVPGKSRDRSHYEHFRAYHESFYRFVEPTSVTPYSIPAIDRALHALIVIIARQEAHLAKPTDLTGVEPWLDDLKTWLVTRAKNAGTEQLYIDALQDRFDLILDLWQSRAKPEWGKASLKKNEHDHLLYPPSAVEELQKGIGRPEFDIPFATPTSMRNVDVECRLKISASFGTGIHGGGDDGEEV